MWGGGRGGRAAPSAPSPATTEGVCHAAQRVWSLGAATAVDVVHAHDLLVARERLVVQFVGGAGGRARGPLGLTVTLLDSSRRGPERHANRPEQRGAGRSRQHGTATEQRSEAAFFGEAAFPGQWVREIDLDLIGVLELRGKILTIGLAGV